MEPDAAYPTELNDEARELTVGSRALTDSLDQLSDHVLLDQSNSPPLRWPAAM